MDYTNWIKSIHTIIAILEKKHFFVSFSDNISLSPVEMASSKKSHNPLDLFRKRNGRDQSISNDEDTNYKKNMANMQGLSYWIKGSFTASGVIKLNRENMKLVCMLISVELTHHLKFYDHFVACICEDIYDEMKTKMIHSQLTGESDLYHSITIDVRKFINKPVIITSTPHVMERHAIQKITLINKNEDVMVVDYKFQLYTGDNQPDMKDALVKKGYIKRMSHPVRDWKLLFHITKISEETNNFYMDHIRQNADLSVAIIGEKHTKLSITTN